MINRWLCFFLINIMVWGSDQVHANFLEMPDTEEVPNLDDDTMLMDLDIPSVRERYPDPQAGPRINVKEFRIQGIVEFPELGITRDAIAERVEKIRFDIMQEDKIVEGGYRVNEIAEMIDLLREIEQEKKDSHVTNLELQRMVFLVRDQMRRRGVTVGMIESVADNISHFYREKGFILAKAYIPKQKVRDGVVNLTLLLGELGSVVVENNKRYSKKALQRVFKNKLYQPVIEESVVEGLSLINDMPGLSARGYFEAGSQVGDTELHIDVLAEERYNANIRFDNHGSKSTGENRVYADFFLYNPFGWSDQWQLGVLNSFDPDNTTYGLLRYRSFILGPTWRISTGISSNDFVSNSVISDAVFEAIGKSVVSDIGLEKFFKRTRTKTLSMGLSYTNIKTELNVAQSDQQDNTLNNTRLGFNFDIMDDKNRALHVGSVAITYSQSLEEFETENRGNNETTDYSFITLNYSLLKFITIPFTKVETRLLAELNGQYSGERQQSVNKFSLTGPKKARGFDVNEFFGDDGLRLGLEWVWSLPKSMNFSLAKSDFNKVIQPYFLADIAHGVEHPFRSETALQEEKISSTFSNVGLGIKLNFARRLKGDFAVSKPIKHDVDIQEQEEFGSKVYFSLQYGF